MSTSDASQGNIHEEHFRRLFEEAPLPYQSLDAEGRLLEVNEEWEKLLGHRREHVLGRFFGEFLVPGQEEKLRRSFQGFLATGKTDRVFLELRSKDGSQRLVEIKGRIALDDQGAFQRTHCILYDITERRRMERALRESEEKYRLAMEVTQDGMWDWNIKSDHVYYSGAWSRILGEKDVRSNYSTWEDRIHPDDKRRVLASLHAHLKRDASQWQEEHRLRHADGSWIWVLGRGQIVERDECGEPVRMVGTMTDIHKRKLAEVALRESEQRYRLLFDSAEELISVFNRDGVCRLVNRCAATFFNRDADELTDKSFTELHFPDGSEYTRRVREVIDTGISRRYEDEVQFPAGKRWLQSRVYPITSTEGKIDAALIISRDVTERRAIEQALRENQEKLKALINATAEDVVVLLNSEFEMEIVNERAARGFGRPVEQLIGHPIGEFMPPEIAASRKEHARRVLESGRSERFEDQRAGRWYDNNMCPVFDSQGNAQAVAIFARDVTERRAMEEMLGKAKDAAEAANIAKSRFLAAANHDLRQPLQALRLLMEALSLHPLESSANQLLLDMTGALKSMEGLLNALLDSSKLEAGSFQPSKRKFHVVPFLHHLRDQFKATAQNAQKQIRVVPTNAVLSTDPVLLGRILHNFVSNALRHARGPSILIGCRRGGRARRIEVWDDGPGIPQDEQQKIFEEFYQLGNPARNAEQGLGLGLSIAKRMAELLNLKIGLRSTIGKGSVFFVEVPIAEEGDEAVQAVSPVPATRNGGGNLILVVDDDRGVLTATEKLLRTLGYEVISAPEAEEAIELAKEWGKSLRLALLDYRLPNGWDGIRLAHRLCSELDRNLPVILITGDIAIGRLREVKLSELPVLHKPIDIEQLCGLMEEVAPRKVADQRTQGKSL